MSHNPYSPPKAEVADAPISAFDDLEGRRDVDRACALLWISMAIGLLTSIIDVVRNFGAKDTAEYVGMLIGLSIGFLITWWFVTKLKAGRNWMRILITVLIGLAFCGLILLATFMSKVLVELYAQYPLDLILSCVQWIMMFALLWLMYTRRSRDWFNAMNS